MACDGTGITDGGMSVGVLGIRGRQVAGQTSEKALSQWAESIGARVE